MTVASAQLGFEYTERWTSASTTTTTTRPMSAHSPQAPPPRRLDDGHGHDDDDDDDDDDVDENNNNHNHNEKGDERQRRDASVDSNSRAPPPPPPAAHPPSAVPPPAPAQEEHEPGCAPRAASQPRPPRDGSSSTSTSRSSASHSRPRQAAWLAIPPPLKRLFDRFPLVTYAANSAPWRSAAAVAATTTAPGALVRLYVFSTAADARAGQPSFNPGCLKWQTFLKFRAVAFATVASNNHASPSGALPFLLPSVSAASLVAADGGRAIVASGMERWVQEQRTGPAAPEKPRQPYQHRPEEESDPRHKPYQSLLDHAIRQAWLHQLYLDPSNAPVLQQLYIHPCSSNPLVRATIGYQLRNAVLAELSFSSSSSSHARRALFTAADVDSLYAAADEAFDALSTLLGDGRWFFDADGPRVLDAAVFAYTCLVLGGDGEGHQQGVIAWPAPDAIDHRSDSRLGQMVRRHANLVRHRDRILREYYRSAR
ncbi:MAG: hypothetical protein M1826_006650 [Phylliscum demangeonii]|nr:MAG: hypothetical protein M1826_006650 [Phylliscum demangeonii]